MIRPVQLHDTFIGKGETTTKTILQTVLNLQQRELTEEEAQKYKISERPGDDL